MGTFLANLRLELDRWVEGDLAWAHWSEISTAAAQLSRSVGRPLAPCSTSSSLASALMRPSPPGLDRTSCRGKPGIDDLGPSDRDPFVDGVHQFFPLLGYVCDLEGLAEGAEPLDCAMAR